jgi:hypothetical protein
MQMLGSALAITALFWGCDKAVAAAQIFGGRTDGVRRLYLGWLKFVVPTVLGVMLILYVADSIS